jgi:4-hydroxy-L-threonine phosphate dehydrogenase PdxA
MQSFVAVTIGDIEGIGIHLLIREFKKKNISNFIIVSNYNILKRKLSPLYNDKLFNKLDNLNQIKNYKKNKINILNIVTKNKHTNTLDSLRVAYNYTKKNKFIGILTLPLNKKKINRYVDNDFIDQTTYFSKLENSSSSSMLFYYKRKFYTPLTTHIELKNVYKFFKNKDQIVSKIINLHKTLKIDFKIRKPKLLIAGINPHSGENGLISNDEKTYMLPIIKELNKKNIFINGPVSGDSIINNINLKTYDAFIFTYHDQALIPFKLISKYQGINFTSGLNIIRVSPSHGTGNDIKNYNNASSKGIMNSFNTIKRIHRNRKNH